MNAYRIFSKHLISNSKKTVKFKFTVFLLTVLTNVLIISFFSYIETSKNRLFQLYGEWRYVISDYAEKEHTYGGVSSNIATITMKNSKDESIDLGPISTIDEKAEELFHLQLLLGSMPEDETEIAVEATTLSTLGIDYEIGQKITLPVNEEETMTYTLVGIIKPYRYQWCLSDKSIIPTAITKTAASLEKIVWLSESEYNQYEQDIIGLGYENTFAYDQTLLSVSMNWFYISLFITMVLIVFVLIFFISKNSFKFMKIEFDILDTLGISLQDKKRIRNWSLFYLCKLSIPLSFILSILGFYSLSLFFHTVIIRVPILICSMATLLITFILFITFPVKQLIYNKKIQKISINKYRHILYVNKKFNVLSYGIRKIQIFKFHYIVLLCLTCIYVSITIFCIFSYVKCMGKSQIELSQETEFDYIISFHNYDVNEANPYGVNSNDIEALKELEAIEDVFTIKMNSADYTYENQEKSESWDTYIDYLNYASEIDNERKSPLILGFSESSKIKDIISSYTTKDLWHNHYGIVTNLYYKTEYRNSDTYEKVLTVQESNGEGFLKDTYLKDNDILNFSNNIIVSTSVLEKISFLEDLNIPNEPYTVSMGDQTFAEIFPDHSKVQFVYIKTNDEANFTTDQQIMNIFSKYDDISIENARLQKENIKNDLHIQLLLITMIEVIATISWVIFYIRIASLKEISTKKMKQILLYLGIDHNFFIWHSLMEALFIAIVSCIDAYASYHYFIKHMTFEIVMFDVENQYKVVDYISNYVPMIVIAVLCIVCFVFILELGIQRERGKKNGFY